jgi:hypothetical protein
MAGRIRAGDEPAVTVTVAVPGVNAAPAFEFPFRFTSSALAFLSEWAARFLAWNLLQSHKRQSARSGHQSDQVRVKAATGAGMTAGACGDPAA